MASKTLEMLVETHDAFNAFSQDASLFALRLQIQSDRLVAFPAVQFPGGDPSDFRKALSKLGSDIDNKIPTYLILRWRGSLAAITYVPYLADAALRDAYLQHRHELVTNLGAANFSLAIICKEPGEVIDARAWEERDGEASSLNEDAKNSCETCSKTEESSSTMKDLGFKKNKCRLCDQRMKNDINADAEGALSTLSDGGACVQLSVDVASETLVLNLSESITLPTDVAKKLNPLFPSYTFYRHPLSNLLYFIYYSPDSATVKERMTHTLAIPGLINIIAKDQGVNVDQKIELHDPEDLVFEERDERIGKFRSMYLRNEWNGTESLYEGMPNS